jgi:hypothetical protein
MVVLMQNTPDRSLPDLHLTPIVVLCGITQKKKMPLYLGEYVPRYDHRKENEKVKARRILTL